MPAIRPLKCTFVEPNVIVFDVETIPRENADGTTELLLKVAVVRRKGDKKYMVCYSNDELTQAILSLTRRRLNIVVAHNAQFDFGFINHKLLAKDYSIQTFNTTPFFVKYGSKKRRRQITFVDTMNYLLIALKTAGDMFGLEKLEIDFDTCSMKELIVYCKRDVDITQLIIDEVFRIHEQFDVSFCVTFPQLAYKVFRKSYLEKALIDAPLLEKPIKTIKRANVLYVSDNKDVRILEREGYYGGRVEVFDFNEYPFMISYDVNSLYPYVMQKFKYPIRCIEHIFTGNEPEIETKAWIQKIQQWHNEDKGIIARVTVTIPESFNVAPVPKRGKDRLLFPVGTFETVLCSPELELVLEYIDEISEISVYLTHDIFSEYIIDFYDMRMNAKEDIKNLLWKLFMNSLYGKFAQRKFFDNRLPIFDNHYEYATVPILDGFGNVIYVKWLGGQAFTKQIVLDNPRSFVAISAFVTAHARVHLFNLLLKYPSSVYCDTDSIFTPNRDIPIPKIKVLGDLKIEKEYQDFKAHGNKLYTFVGGYKAKGVRKKDINGNPTQFDVRDNGIVITTTRISRLTETIKRFGKTNPHIVSGSKFLSLRYTKRQVLDDLTTKPLLLPTCEDETDHTVTLPLVL